MMNSRHLSLLALLLLGACDSDPPPVKDKAYYSAHRDELEAENRRCREAGLILTDEACRRIDVIRGEIFRADVGRQIRTQ